MKKITAAIWFVVSLMLLTADTMTMWYYIPIIGNFILCVLFISRTFKSEQPCRG